MCLGVPGKIVEMNEEQQWVIVERLGVKSKVYTPLVDEPIHTGDYVMVHAGYAIGKMDPGEARSTLELLQGLTE